MNKINFKLFSFIIILSFLSPVISDCCDLTECCDDSEIIIFENSCCDGDNSCDNTSCSFDIERNFIKSNDNTASNNYIQNALLFSHGGKFIIPNSIKLSTSNPRLQKPLSNIYLLNSSFLI